MIAKAKKIIFEASREYLGSTTARSTSTKITISTFYKWIRAWRNLKKRHQNIAPAPSTAASTATQPSARTDLNSDAISRPNSDQISSDRNVVLQRIRQLETFVDTVE